MEKYQEDLLRIFLSEKKRKNGMIFDFIYFDGEYLNASDGVTACRVKTNKEEDTYLYDPINKEKVKPGIGKIPNYKKLETNESEVKVKIELTKKNVTYLKKVHQNILEKGDKYLSLSLDNMKIVETDTKKMKGKFQGKSEQYEKMEEIHYHVEMMIKIMGSLEKVMEQYDIESIQMKLFAEDRPIIFSVGGEIEIYLMPIKLNQVQHSA